jgi:hypothetical protein
LSLFGFNRYDVLFADAAFVVAVSFKFGVNFSSVIEGIGFFAFDSTAKLPFAWVTPEAMRSSLPTSTSYIPTVLPDRGFPPSSKFTITLFQITCWKTRCNPLIKDGKHNKIKRELPLHRIVTW